MLTKLKVVIENDPNHCTDFTITCYRNYLHVEKLSKKSVTFTVSQKIINAFRFWQTSLRTTDYPQIYKELYSEDGFCSIGVLGDCCIANFVDKYYKDGFDEFLSINDLSMCLGFEKIVPNITLLQEIFTNLNDDAKLSFLEIAESLEHFIVTFQNAINVVNNREFRVIKTEFEYEIAATAD